MSLWHVWRERLRALQSVSERDRELNEEIAWHLEAETERLIASGIPRVEARRLAEEHFGNRNRIVDATRDERPGNVMGAALQDIRWAMRSLRRGPGFAIGAGLILTLAVGATTAVFTVVNAVLIRPLPYARPQRLFAVSDVYAPAGRPPEDVVRGRLTDVERWRPRATSLEAIGAFAYSEEPIQVGNAAYSPVTALMDPEFLPMLGVPLARGSYFERRNGEGVDFSAIISDRLWREAFGADPAAVGRTVSVNGQVFVVRGILPRGFQFPRADAAYSARPVDLAVPAATMPGFPHGNRQWLIIARLKDGVSPAQARDQLRALAAGDASENPPDRDWTVAMQPLAEATAAGSRLPLLIVFAITLILLAIASSNVVNLLLSRGATRAHELAIRRAMGCTTVRLVRQLISESTVLTLLSGVAGIGLAALTTNAIVALSPVRLPLTERIGVDWRVTLFAIVMSLLTGALAGLVPALHAARTSDSAVRSPGTRASAGRELGRIQGALCVTQVALGVALLTVAGSLVGGLARLGATDPGFRSDGVFGFSLSFPGDRPMEARRTFYQQTLDDIGSIPGVTSVGLITFLPPETRAGVFMPIEVDGEAAPPPNAPGNFANYLVTSPDYFRTIGVTMAAGRNFTPDDNELGRRVVVVNEAFARRYLGGNAVGRRLSGAFGVDHAEVVGVVHDSHDRGLARDAIPTLFVPFRQFAMMYGAIAIRSSVSPASIIPEIRRRMTRLDPAVPLVDFQTIDSRIHSSLDEPRFYSLLAGGCAGMAVLFVALGLFGLVSFSVSRRTAEFGIRMAVGASSGMIQRLVLRQGVLLAVTGAAIGIALAILPARALGALPFPVRPADPALVGGSVGLVVLVTMLASWLPAWRASRVSPLAALRLD